MTTLTRYEYLKVCMEDNSVLHALSGFSPVVIGTIPIGIDLPGSDVDIACQADDFDKFDSVLKAAFGRHKDFEQKRKSMRDHDVSLCRFQLDGFDFEVFCQYLPVELQYGVRHFRIEKLLLELKGEPFREAVMKLRYEGLKTEPAFARILGLAGDPYEALLELEGQSPELLRDMPVTY